MSPGDLERAILTAKTSEDWIALSRVARKFDLTEVTVQCPNCLERGLLAVWELHEDRCHLVGLIADKGLQEIEQWLETQ